jgi:PKD repeat protein
MLAYDYCVRYVSGDTPCSVHIASSGDDLYIADGMDPTWSPDGSQIAFAGDNQYQFGIFILNLADWSVVNVRATGGAPAWSPDGSRLAFSWGGPYVMRPDGSDAVLLTSGVGSVQTVAWSPDGQTIVFDCEIEQGNRDICTINADGTGLVRLTTDPGWASDPVFSADGSKIWFATYGTDPDFSPRQSAVMNTDGTGLQVYEYDDSYQYAWSADGTHVAWVVYVNGDGCPADRMCPETISATNIDGPTYGNRPAWGLSGRPVAWAVTECNGLTCSLDGSRSWGGNGGIVSYAWSFGDGTTGSGAAVTHTYAAGGRYVVTLTVVDTTGVSGTRTTIAFANAPPVAAFTFGCTGLTCAFDASGSSDPDGSVSYYQWSFGDAIAGSGVSATHTYVAAGTYAVVLTVTDNAGATSTQTRSVVAARPVMHVGDLDGASTVQRNTWTATVAISLHDSAHAPVPNAVVTALWSDGAGSSCTTDAVGRCVVSKSGIPRKAAISLAVTGARQDPFFYDAAANHDADGDSDGTGIGIPKQ